MNDESNQIKPRGGKANAKKPRTKAQEEASRKNGAKSKGPVSKAGKITSRQNALKHGLTAKFLTPPKDPRNQDQLYEQVHEELNNEYEPQGFTAQSTVSNLAHDYVQMIRCRQMMEALQTPMQLPEKECQAWEELQVTKREHEDLIAAITCLAGGKDISFSPKTAFILAKKVAEYAASIEDDIQKINQNLLVVETCSSEPKEAEENQESNSPDGAHDDGTPDGACDDGEEVELIPEDELITLPEQWEIIKPVCRRLSDLDYLTAVFSGNAVPSGVVARRLRHILEWIDQRIATSISSQKNLEAKANTLSNSIIMKLATEPDRIMLLERYLRDIERSVERKMKQLSELQSLGSFREDAP